MKIIRTIESFYPAVSGPANQAFMISRMLFKHGIDSQVFTSDLMAKKSPAEEVIKGVNVKRFKSKASFLKYIYTPQIKSALIKAKPDIIHAHNFRSYQGQAGFFAAKKLGVPYVINTHGGLLGYKSITKGIKQMPYKAYDFFIGKKIINGSDAVVVSSDQEYDEALLYGVDKKKLHVIPMGIDVSEYKTERKNKENLTALFVGRLSRNRNLEPIIKAMAYADKNIMLRIVGDEAKSSDTSKSGYVDELKQLVKSLKLENIEFAGPKYEKELINEYKNADIFVNASVYENFGQCILEAAASGLPLISTRVGVASELIKDSKRGFFIDDCSPKIIAEKINLLLDSRLRKEMGRLIQRDVENKYNWDDIIMEYENIYLKIKK